MREVPKTDCPGPSPQELLVPKPLAKKPNTGRNASNSRFFSDCNNQPLPNMQAESDAPADTEARVFLTYREQTQFP
jgi:hypothetical protein